MINSILPAYSLPFISLTSPHIILPHLTSPNRVSKCHRGDADTQQIKATRYIKINAQAP